MSDQNQQAATDKAPGSGTAEEQQGQAPAFGADAFFGKKSKLLDDWLAIEPDGMVTVFSGKVELGTGTRTALGQIVAEELDVPFERVRLVMGDTARTPDEGYTAGSMTIEHGGATLRNAAAEARLALIELALEELDATPEDLMLRDGVVTDRNHPDRAMTYAELMGGKKFERQVSEDAPVKQVAEYRVVGMPVERVDLPKKFTGQASFIQDLRVPGMVYGHVVRPPSAGAKLVALDENSVKDVRGLIKVVHLGNFVGVVAEREQDAIRAAKELKVEWAETASLPAMEDLYEMLRDQTTQDALLKEEGNVTQALGKAVKQLHATYYQPYHAHASIGPSCAVGDVRAEGSTVWCSTQGPFPLRGALAQLLQMPAEKLRLVHVEGAGCYGQNGSDDVAADALVLSREVGRPVRVQWSREQEFVWEPKAAAMIVEITAGLDAQGKVSGWQYEVWSPTHTSRPRFAPQLIAFQLMNEQPAPPTRFFLGGERNAENNYAFADQAVKIHWLPNSPLRVSSFRSLGAAGNTFANESFMDELAHAAGADPVEFRLRHLEDERGRDVLKAATDAAGWKARTEPQEKGSGVVEGRGVAYAQYENEQARVACVALVEVNTASGAVRVKRIVVAHDCGLIVNPDGVKNQIEGNVIQSLSRALLEEVKFDHTRVTSVDWQTYPILTFSQMPEVEVVLVNRPDQPSMGAGEAATVTTAAAVANAIFDATGARLREVPFTPERVKKALGERR